MQHDQRAPHWYWQFLKLALMAISGAGCPTRAQIDEASDQLAREDPGPQDGKDALARFVADLDADPISAGAALRNFILDRSAPEPADSPDWQSRKDCGHE